MLHNHPPSPVLSAPALHMLGDSCLLLQWKEEINIQTNLQVHHTAAALKSAGLIGVLDIVPAYCSLTILFDLRLFVRHYKQLPLIYFQANLEQLTSEPLTEAVSKTQIRIPVCYDTSLGNDLEWLAAHYSLPAEEIIHLHLSRPYFVYMLGFLPGFSYMGEVNEKIAFPRKEKPVGVNAGAVAIAGKQTGIYPVDSPGGWNVLGYTPLAVFDASAEKPCLLQPGAEVIFSAISIEEWHHYKNGNSWE